MTIDFVIPAKAGIQGFFKWLIFRTKHWTPTFVGVTTPCSFTLKWEFESFFSTLQGWTMPVVPERLQAGVEVIQQSKYPEKKEDVK